MRILFTTSKDDQPSGLLISKTLPSLKSSAVQSAFTFRFSTNSSILSPKCAADGYKRYYCTVYGKPNELASFNNVYHPAAGGQSRQKSSHKAHCQHAGTWCIGCRLSGSIVFEHTQHILPHNGHQQHQKGKASYFTLAVAQEQDRSNGGAGATDARQYGNGLGQANDKGIDRKITRLNSSHV